MTSELWAGEIQSTRANFEQLLGVAEHFLSSRRPETAAVAAAIAAHYAAYCHPGIFASARLDRLLSALGSSTDCGAGRSWTEAKPECKRVLHVLTSAKDVGGDTRFVWRWIERDVGRSHSVALTRQRAFPVPRELAVAVEQAHGAVHILDQESSGSLDRAKRLQKLSNDFDFVALHVYPEDIVPGIAFATANCIPTIAAIAQADHQFWSFNGVADLAVYLRESGARLGAHRRRGRSSATSFLPIPVEVPAMTLGRREAKERLGLPADAIVVLTIARALKYEPIEGPGFAELLAPVIQSHPKALLLAIGPVNSGQWKAASDSTDGRVRALGQRSDTALYYRAADIYVDSYPFTSNTSLLEAGSHGLPLVTLVRYSGDAEVLGAGAPGIDRTMLRARSVEDWRKAVSDLITDRHRREEVGLETRVSIMTSHGEKGWRDHCEAMYRDARHHGESACVTGEFPTCHEEVDVLLHRIYSAGVTLGWIIGWNARDMPYLRRIDLLRRMLAVDATFSFSMFLPGIVSRIVSSWAAGWRRWPLVKLLGVAGGQGIAGRAPTGSRSSPR